MVPQRRYQYWLSQRKWRLIWNEWADENGDLGPVYGHQWRNWNSENIDQIKDVIKTLKHNPDSRMLVSAWNPSVMPEPSKPFAENVANGKAALPHVMPFPGTCCRRKAFLSALPAGADIFLGVPFNIASYALFTYMMAQACSYKPELGYTFEDAHIYTNHMEQIKLQLSRKPKPSHAQNQSK